MIDTFPVEWTSPGVREVLSILETIYRQSEIESIVVAAGLRPGQISWNDRAAITWRSVYNYAAGQLRTGPLLDAVATEYPALKVRIDEIVSSSGEALSSRPPSDDPSVRDYVSPGWKNFSQNGRQERIIDRGKPTFVDVSFLALAIDKARSVCRLVTRFADQNGGGTGFRVGTHHILTNHHVLFDDVGDRIVAGEAWFNYETDECGATKEITTIPCLADSIIGDKEHDWAIVRTQRPIPDAFPALPIFGARQPKVDDRVCIIQHPNGLPKQIAFQHNLIRDVGHDVMQYWTDTDLGSSGSPVFNAEWEVVGLHHYSVTAPDHERVDFRNQGRLIDRVVESMREHGLEPKALR